MALGWIGRDEQMKPDRYAELNERINESFEVKDGEMRPRVPEDPTVTEQREEMKHDGVTGFKVDVLKVWAWWKKRKAGEA